MLSNGAGYRASTDRVTEGTCIPLLPFRRFGNTILTGMRQAAGGVSSISMSLDNWTVGMEERRNERRTRVLLPASILMTGGDRLACSIRDLSAGGARLHVRSDATVPERFDLIVDADGRRFKCEVRHRSGSSINVQFCASSHRALGCEPNQAVAGFVVL